jgi:uncharacterized membrane protein YfcA
MKKKLLSITAGALTGAVNGLFGAGGGLILVPLLIRTIKLDTAQALPTSVAIILPMCAVSAVSYVTREGMGFMTLLPYLAGGLVGGVVAGLTFGKFPTIWLRRALGAFIVYAGVRMVFGI